MSDNLEIELNKVQCIQIGFFPLLGMPDEGRKEFPDEAPPHALTSGLYIISAPSEFVLQEEQVSLDSGGLT
jgi:hypothetical protein